MSSYRDYQRIIRLPTPSYSANKIGKSDSQSRTSPLSANTHSLECTHNHIAKEKKKITRTKTGCFCCRKRKKKCDERKPICSGCLRNNLTCVYPTDEELKKTFTPSSTSSRKIKKYSKLQSEILSPQNSDSTPNSSDVESPIASPTLQPYQYTLSSSTSKIPFFNINNIDSKKVLMHDLNTSKPSRHISVKSLLN